MLRKILAVSLLLCGLTTAQVIDLNTVGYGDTTQSYTFSSFRSDSLKFSKNFPLSAWENARVDIIFDDTSSAGFASDSCKFAWGFQTGHKVEIDDTLYYAYDIPYPVDTVDLVGSTNMYDHDELAVIGYVQDTVTLLNTSVPFAVDTGVGGATLKAVQSRNIVPQWDEVFRIWLKGLTGNKVGSYVEVEANVRRRRYSNVRTR